MKSFWKFFTKALASGFLIAVPVYLAMLLLLKAAKSLVGLVRPLAVLRPPGVPVEAAATGFALLFVLLICFALGAAALTEPGRAVEERIRKSVLEKIPGYQLVRGLTQQLAGQTHENVWKPALAEIEEALVPAFIIEEMRGGRFTVFVPGVPSPLMGSVYILQRERVHPVNASFAQAFKVLSRWGSGAKDLVAAMESERHDAETDSTPRAAEEDGIGSASTH